eukprot:scaffold24451_cov18-Tisochrysis_lutea.AAC.1
MSCAEHAHCARLLTKILVMACSQDELLHTCRKARAILTALAESQLELLANIMPQHAIQVRGRGFSVKPGWKKWQLTCHMSGCLTGLAHLHHATACHPSMRLWLTCHVRGSTGLACSPSAFGSRACFSTFYAFCSS